MINLDVKERSASSPNPYAAYIAAASDLVSIGSATFSLLRELHRKLVIYTFISLAVVTMAWLLNIFGHKNIIVVVIPVFIGASVVLMYRANVIAPLFLGSLAHQVIDTGELNLTQIQRAFEIFLLLVCSIIYSATWPLILLSWLTFEHSPSHFWVMYSCLIMLVVMGEVMRRDDSSPPGILERISLALRNAAFVSTPRKLFAQLITASAKIVLLFS